MSTYLLLDTATSRTSVVVVTNGGVVFNEYHDGALSHGESLPKLVAAALKVSPQIDEVIVGMGPGPFTGLRV